MSFFNKDAKIKSLQAEIQELKTQAVILKRYDRFFQCVMDFPTLSDFMDYLEIKAQLNLELLKHVGFWRPNDTPSEISGSQIRLMKAVAPFEERIIKWSEAAGVVLSVQKDSK